MTQTKILPEIDESPIVQSTEGRLNPWRLKTKEFAYVNALVGEAKWDRETAAKMAGFKSDDQLVLSKTIESLHDLPRVNGWLSDFLDSEAEKNLSVNRG